MFGLHREIIQKSALLELNQMESTIIWQILFPHIQSLVCTKSKADSLNWSLSDGKIILIMTKHNVADSIHPSIINAAYRVRRVAGVWPIME